MSDAEDEFNERLPTLCYNLYCSYRKALGDDEISVDSFINHLMKMKFDEEIFEVHEKKLEDEVNLDILEDENLFVEFMSEWMVNLKDYTTLKTMSKEMARSSRNRLEINMKYLEDKYTVLQLQMNELENQNKYIMNTILNNEMDINRLNDQLRENERASQLLMKESREMNSIEIEKLNYKITSLEKRIEILKRLSYTALESSTENTINEFYSSSMRSMNEDALDSSNNESNASTNSSESVSSITSSHRHLTPSVSACSCPNGNHLSQCPTVISLEGYTKSLYEEIIETVHFKNLNKKNNNLNRNNNNNLNRNNNNNNTLTSSSFMSSISPIVSCSTRLSHHLRNDETDDDIDIDIIDQDESDRLLKSLRSNDACVNTDYQPPENLLISQQLRSPLCRVSHYLLSVCIYLIGYLIGRFLYMSILSNILWLINLID
ncbi:hypothetical protein SNEBB_009030 [Seison nebaliae]|nr:hypothetical protein SNEBB_009030 [Seison nebaliae]